jgi:hypothetical protein
MVSPQLRRLVAAAGGGEQTAIRPNATPPTARVWPVRVRTGRDGWTGVGGGCGAHPFRHLARIVAAGWIENL